MALLFKDKVKGSYWDSHGSYWDSKKTQWDSELIVPPAVENAILRITLRLELRRYDAEVLELTERDRNGKPLEGKIKIIDTRPWPGADWIRFGERVKSLCEQYWNNEFWLEPPRDCAILDVPYSPLNGMLSRVFATTPTHRPYIKCEIQVQLVGALGAPHRKIVVLHLDKDQPRFRNSAKLWDQTIIDWTSAGGQLAVVHEVGHLLNLFHPGVDVVPGCTRKDNSRPECYCVDGWCGELMGKGMVVTNRLALPWQTSMYYHTGIEARQWGVLRVPRRPQLIALLKNPGASNVNLGVGGAAFGG